MKKNLISAIAGWKSAALLALIAMVATVAFSGVLSTTHTADARLGDDQTVAPGATVTLPGDIEGIKEGVWTTWTIATTGAASATFESGGGTTLVCQDVGRTGTCDANPAGGFISVKVKIASDSGAGAVVVRAGVLTAANTTDAVVLTVDPTLVPTKITLTPSKTAHPASEITDDQPVLNIKVTNSLGKGVAVKVSLTTTLGMFHAADGNSNCAEGGGTLACTTASTDATDGTLKGAPKLAPTANRPGVATVVATVVGYPSVTATATVTFFGPAKNIEASPQQGSIQIGGQTFIVVTVTDAAGSPVSGIVFGNDTRPVTAKAPSVIAKAIRADVNRDYDANGNRIADKGDIQACGDDSNASDPTPSTNLTGANADGTGAGLDVGVDVPAGTNQAGQCVIMVSADGPPAAAARGAHTVTAVLAAATSATATVNVGGPPASITSDAPASVDPLSETSVNLTVLDDEGIAVGETALDIDLISPQGLITVNPTTTKDGKATFSFIVALDGEVVFRVAAGTPGVDQITDSITITVGEAAMDDMEMATWNKPLVSGQNLVVWNGADGADPPAAGDVTIWSYNAGSGTWDGYFPMAADVPGGNTLTSLSNGEAYWVIQ